MGDTTAIEWTDHTFNAWWGCSRVSPACRFCYADRDASRWGHELWRRHGDRKPMSEDYWRKPAKWNREAERAGRPAKVFCASMSDVFEDHPQVGPWRERLFGVIESTPWLIWQLLTKRIENVAGMVPWTGTWPANVWIGTSVETERFARQRLPILRRLDGAAVRFVSCEPVLGPLDLRQWLNGADDWSYNAECLKCGTENDYDPAGHPRIHYCTNECAPDDGPGCELEGEEIGWCLTPEWHRYPRVDWLIAGGESGPKARPSHPDWFRSLRDQCAEAGVPYFHKQNGQYAAVVDRPRDGDLWIGLDGKTRSYLPDDGHVRRGLDDFRQGDASLIRRYRSKHDAGHDLDGRRLIEFPLVAEAVSA